MLGQDSRVPSIEVGRDRGGTWGERTGDGEAWGSGGKVQPDSDA